MPVRYKTECSGLHGQEWKVEIIDTAWAGAELEYTAGSPGFELSYKTEGDARFKTLKESELRLYIVQSATDTDLQELLDDMLVADEDQFFVKLYRNISGSYTFEWAGMMLQDLIQQPDASPTVINIAFTDGLGILKDKVPAYTANFVQDGYARYTYILHAILAETPLYKLLTNTDNFMATTAQWYETQMYTTSPAGTLDPLWKTYLYELALREGGEDDTAIGDTLMDSATLLDKLLAVMGCRIIQANGLWNIIQVGEYAGTSIVQRYYLRTGAQSGTANNTLSHRKALDQSTRYRKATATYGWLPGLQEVKVTYLPLNSNIVPYVSSYPSGVDCGAITGDATQYYFRLEFQILYWALVNVYFSYFVKFEVLLRVTAGGTNYYLTNIPGSADAGKWSTTNTDRFFVRGRILSGKKWDILGANITTEQLPHASVTAVRLAISFDGAFYTNNGTPIGGSIPNFGYDLSDASGKKAFLFPVLVDENEVDTLEYTATNTSPDPYSETVEIEAAFGDGPFDFSVTALQVENAAGTRVDTDNQWKVDGSGTAYPILQLLANELLAGQKTPVKLLQGEVGGAWISPVETVQIGSEWFVFNGGTYDAQRQCWGGEWFYINRDITNITTNTTPRLGRKLITDTAVRGAVADLNGGIVEVFNRTFHQIGYISEFIIETDIDAGDTIGTGNPVTTIAIQAAVRAHVLDGDSLVIFNPATGLSETIVCDGNVSVSDTALAIASHTFTNAYAPGSTILIDRYNLTTGNLRAGGTVVQMPNLPTSDPGISGHLWIGPGGQLMVSV